MGHRRLLISASVLVVLVLGGTALARAVTQKEVASGSGRDGHWRLVASRDFGGYCLKLHTRTGEGGACHFAEPATLNESTTWLAYRNNSVVTLIAGPVPPGSSRVEVTPAAGDPIRAELAKLLLGMTFFIAEAPGVQGVQDIRAFDRTGRMVEGLAYRPMPPPVPPTGPGPSPPVVTPAPPSS